MKGVGTIRETPFGNAIGTRILDITTGDFGDEDEYRVYFHLDNGQTLYTTIGDENQPTLMGMIDMDVEDEEE